jgi:hypothetical protein
LEVKITIGPSSDQTFQLLRRPTPDTYTCEALVVDPEKKMIFARASVVAAPGVKEESKSKVGEAEIEFSVLISRPADRADTRVVVKKSGKVLTRQSSTVRLVNTRGNRYQPVQ